MTGQSRRAPHFGHITVMPVMVIGSAWGGGLCPDGVVRFAFFLAWPVHRGRTTRGVSLSLIRWLRTCLTAWNRSSCSG